MSHTSSEFPVIMREPGERRQIVDVAHSLAQLLTTKESLVVATRRPLLVTSFGPATISVDAYDKEVVGAIVPNDRPDSLIVEQHAAVADDWMVDHYKNRWCGTATIAHETERARPGSETVQGSLYYYLGGAWFVDHSVEIAYLGIIGDAKDAPEDPRFDSRSRDMLQGFVGRRHTFENPGLQEAVDMILHTA
jgi:hypothetical protein